MKKKITTVSDNTQPESTRLNKYISNAGICSRRAADELIKDGEIKVNGVVVSEVGTKINKGDVVEYKGKKIFSEALKYVLLNKPKDFITTTKDELDRKTVMQLVANACKERIYPVGRLDRNTTGLLLLTNDGDLAKKLLHPSGKIQKLYKVKLNQPITQNIYKEILEGTKLDDGVMEVDELAILSPDKRELGIQIHSGKNRVIRRLFEHYGYEVMNLDRVMFAGLDKKDLPRGKWRHLSEKEIRQLRHFMKK